MIAIPLGFRGISFIGIVMMTVTIVFIRLNSKEKHEYDHVQGHVIYLDQKMGELPSRDKGLYRYLIIDTYPFPFEIYADRQAKRIDSLNAGENVTVYFYETAYTKSEKLNRYVQYIEKGEKMFFERTGFQKTLGFFLFAMSWLLIIFGFALWKAKKINY